jgi:hypothetical protein
MNIVKIYSQDLDKIDRAAGQFAFKANWDLPRKHTLTYQTKETGLKVAEEAFHILNATASMMTIEQRQIAQYSKAHSLSVGDVVECEGIQYLCAPMGWLERRIS